MRNFINWFKSEESGQGMVEYALIIALLAVVLIGALTALSGGIGDIFTKIKTELETAKNKTNPLS